MNMLICLRPPVLPRPHCKNQMIMAADSFKVVVKLNPGCFKAVLLTFRGYDKIKYVEISAF